MRVLPHAAPPSITHHATAAPAVCAAALHLRANAVDTTHAFTAATLMCRVPTSRGDDLPTSRHDDRVRVCNYRLYNYKAAADAARHLRARPDIVFLLEKGLRGVGPATE